MFRKNMPTHTWQMISFFIIFVLTYEKLKEANAKQKENIMGIIIDNKKCGAQNYCSKFKHTQFILRIHHHRMI